LDAIKSKAKVAAVSCPVSQPSAPVPPPPPPPKPPQGKLAIRCAPGECEIGVNDTPRGSTHNGLLEVAELPVGPSKITFRKNGYLDRQTVVTIEPNDTVSISEILSPNRATQEAFGAELFQKVVEAIGMSEAKEQFAIEAGGTISTWSC